MDASSLVLEPRVSEQTFSQAENEGVYVFVVPTTAIKDDIKQAVEAQFDVSVSSVNVSITKGKTRSSVRRRLQSVEGSRPKIKKAYVRLKKGDKITVLDAGVQ